MTAMTPIKQIVRDSLRVYTEDWAGNLELVCVSDSEEKAKWVAWSLGRAHEVDVTAASVTPTGRWRV